MEESLSYMDQCTVICLGYISCFGNLEIQSGEADDPENLESLCTIADQELIEFGEKEELQIFLNTSACLAEKFKNSDNDEEAILECLTILQSSLDQENFNECADSIITHPIESWDKVSQILHLVYRACEQLGSAKVGTVIDVGVRYMRKNFTDFVTSQGGWRSLGFEKSQETEQLVKEEDPISSSIVLVSDEGLDQGLPPKFETAVGAGDASAAGIFTNKASPQNEEESFNLQDSSVLASPKNRTPVPLSPLSTPPFSIPSSTNTDDDRDSLATPPEMVEKPLMTESFIRAMGGEDIRRESSGNGNDFEIIGSENGASMTDSQNVMQSIEESQVSELVVEKEEISSVQSSNAQSADLVVVNEEISSEQSSTAQSELDHKVSTQTASIVETETTSEEEPILGGYLPHISLGVAAAAAVAGFFVLKKNM
uniref:uncharacterized protein LOC120330860 isoform X1 n=1 Tax=Styela clava TaxID=7725 RepID=UPI00193A7393|nr:uncharacterized protein LOC120330860 isoform X1 [Styela clava]